jgi:thioredoxin 1
MATVIKHKDEFEKILASSDKALLIDFYADWCGPCVALAPKLEELASRYEGKAEVIKVDVDQHQEIAARYGVRGIPALFFVKKGEVTGQLVGNQPTDSIESELKKHI